MHESSRHETVSAGSPRIWVCFSTMQEERERADYDPLIQFFRTDALQRIQETEDAISKFESECVDDKSRRAFAVWVLLDQRA